jgi:uncharacterized damage-inducible protein DinB
MDSRYAEPMAQLQAEQARFLFESVYLPSLRNEHRITKSVIDAIPVDKSDFRPDNVAKSAIELAWHVVAAEMRFFEALPAGAFDFSPKPRPESVRNSRELSDWYVENFAKRLDALTQLTDDQILKVVDFRGMFQLPAVSYLEFILHHTIHHRGQLSMYLRPMGAKVPSIYGESYDAEEARKAAQHTA